METRRENIKWVTFPIKLWSFSAFLCYSTFVDLPAHKFSLLNSKHHWTKRKTIFPCQFFISSLPPTLALDLGSSLHVSSLPEQTGLLSFTIGPGLKGWLAYKGSASLLSAAKKLKEGIVWTLQAPALHQLEVHLKKNECMHSEHEITHAAHMSQ